jgi:hypothetical protein
MFKQMIFGAVAALGLAAAANAEVLLEVDLTVPNTVTITATDGLSAATISGSDTTGVYLADFYSAPTTASVVDTLVSGDLTNFLNPSDASPAIFNSSGNSGLNVWSFSSDSTVDFVAGTQAFTGSATWTVDAANYAEMIAGNLSGDLYFPADSDDDLSAATLIGEWRVVIPAPGAMALLGVAGLVGTRRRR